MKIIGQQRAKEWESLDLEMLKKHMRCDYRSSALYKCGKNISKLTNKEKYQLIKQVFTNFWDAGYSKYDCLFLDLYCETFKAEIEDIGKNKMDRYLLKFDLK